MLRITVQENTRNITLKLEGKIAGPWVAELDHVWQSLLPNLGTRTVLVDMCGIAFADAQGVKLLQTIYHTANAQFQTDSPLMRYFAESAMREIPKNSKEGA